MIYREANIIKILEKPLTQEVFYYFSTEEYLVRRYAEKTIKLLQSDGDAEFTQLDGPVPDVGEAVAAMGTISMFGTKRIVYLSLVDPAAMPDADVKALCDLCRSLENSVLVLTSVFRDDKAKLAKKAKQLITACEDTGLVGEFIKPQPVDAKRFAQSCAQRLGASLSPTGAAALVDRCKTDYFLLENEVAKLAAASGYGEISQQLIADMSAQSIEADVFEMVRDVTGRRTGRALAKLQKLFDLQNEPIAIAAALSGSFVDMARVKAGAKRKKPYAAVFKEFEYKGKDFRLKRASETAAGYSHAQLCAALDVLMELDEKLKSSPVSGEVLLQTALCELAEVTRK